MNNLISRHVALLCLFVTFGASAIEDQVQQLDEVIVSTPTGDGTLKTTPHNVTVITSSDIDKAASSSLVDLLSRQANVNLQSYFGTDKWAAVDMRGMGDTATSNVLIMVDGVRRNELDLSGADFSTIPLSQIERIEIIRGGGSVIYGNGAVAGIINIITKRGKPGTQSLAVETTRGSYDLKDTRLQATGSAGPFVASVNLSKMDTDGFRKNSGLRSNNASAELRFLPTGMLDFLEAYARVATHYDEYGFPGGVSSASYAAGSKERRSTNSPYAGGETSENNYVFGINADFEKAGQLKFQSSMRDRINHFVPSYNPLLSLRAQRWTIDSLSKSFRLQYDNTFNLLGMQEKLTIGADKLDGNYTRWENGRNNDASVQRPGDVSSTGTFANLNIQPFAGLTLTGGYRTNRFKTDMSNKMFDCATNPLPPFQRLSCDYQLQSTQGGTWNNDGSELGVTWQPSDTWTTFVSLTKHFRTPNLDELAKAAENLHPQSGRTAEVGLRYSPNRTLEASITVFRMRNEDEIYYGADPSSGLAVNRNYEMATIRKGVEAEIRWKPLPDFSVLTNIGYVSPQFENTNADIPLVPRQTANVTLEWQVLPDLAWSMSGRHVGSSYNGSDFDNTLYPKVESYNIYNTALRYQYKKLEVSAGVNNLFNEIYVTKVYAGDYYPMPDRNGFVRVRLKF